ncbi:MBOAT family protein [candidate division KSB1 bacterium]|nr:MBOAT family protein [candidate division KSB1 bacterium]
MLFNSMTFLVFFVVQVIVYFLLPHKYRWILLLAGSYYFYMSWKPEYIILIIVSTLIDYICGIQIGKTSVRSRKRLYLIISLLSNLGILFAFKYFNFFNASVRMLFNSFSIAYHVPQFNILLPVGISFYTFQTLSYTIDVYRGKMQPERNLGIFALYVSFFPQLVAGPIERATNLLPQFLKKITFDSERFQDGLRQMLWGFFKKVVVADMLAFYVNTVYNQVHAYSGLQMLIATYFFAFQIYCDFSGYSDIAIGVARMMGFDLMKNFNLPYFSRSIPEFWRRWHISLSTWFKDYLYIPLGGNRCSVTRWYFNIFMVFLISGLWHGADWKFVIWGALHGFYQVFSMLTATMRDTLVRILRIPRVLRSLFQTVFTFHLVCFSWIFFRANSMSEALFVVKSLFTNFGSLVHLTANWGRYNFMVALCATVILLLFEIVRFNTNYEKLIRRTPGILRWGVYYLIILLLILFGVDSNSQFIYFQF